MKINKLSENPRSESERIESDIIYYQNSAADNKEDNYMVDYQNNMAKVRELKKKLEKMNKGK